MQKIPVRKIKEPDFSDGFNIKDISTLLSGREMIQELHRHDFFFILVLEKGLGEHTIDFTPYAITNYTVFFMHPGQVHQLKLAAESTGYLMQFNTKFYSPQHTPAMDTFRKVKSKNHCQLDEQGTQRLLTVLDSIYQEYTTKPEQYKEVIRANMEIFFIELIRQSKAPEHLLKNQNSYAQEQVEALMELLNIHISRIKQVAQYAELLHLSTYQLNAITKEILGKTCSQLINERILLEAKRQILATSSQINQIAFELGYEDVSYFIRFFKKHTGYTPETFRHNFR